MFRPPGDRDYRAALPGVEFEALVHGERTMLTEFHLSEGATVPPHDHPHEQTGYLVKGRLDFVVGDQRVEAAPGTSWNIPGGVVHSATALEDSIVVEVFSPVREDYLP